MPRTVQPIVITTDMARLHAFYAAVADAVETDHTPPEGPAFCVVFASATRTSTWCPTPLSARTTCRGVNGSRTPPTRTATSSTLTQRLHPA